MINADRAKESGSREAFGQKTLRTGSAGQQGVPKEVARDYREMLEEDGGSTQVGIQSEGPQEVHPLNDSRPE